MGSESCATLDPSSRHACHLEVLEQEKSRMPPENVDYHRPSFDGPSSLEVPSNEGPDADIRTLQDALNIDFELLDGPDAICWPWQPTVLPDLRSPDPSAVPPNTTIYLPPTVSYITEGALDPF